MFHQYSQFQQLEHLVYVIWAQSGRFIARHNFSNILINGILTFRKRRAGMASSHRAPYNPRACAFRRPRVPRYATKDKTREKVAFLARVISYLLMILKYESTGRDFSWPQRGPDYQHFLAKRNQMQMSCLLGHVTDKKFATLPQISTLFLQKAKKCNFVFPSQHSPIEMERRGSVTVTWPHKWHSQAHLYRVLTRIDSCTSSYLKLIYATIDIVATMCIVKRV